MLTHARLLELIEYLPESGFLLWRTNRGRVRAGSVAGYLQQSSKRKGYVYLALKIDGKEYAAHRLAWFYMTGEMPPPEVHVDHRDNSSLNNKWGNLRKSDHTSNQWNRGVQSNNRLGMRGVTQVGRRFRARISKHNKRHNLGIFDTPEAAAQAYKEASVNMHGEFASVNLQCYAG